jgi:hypothetical protein
MITTDIGVESVMVRNPSLGPTRVAASLVSLSFERAMLRLIQVGPRS